MRSLVEEGVHVVAELPPVDRRCTCEAGHHSLRANELTLSRRCQFADRNSVARYYECLASVERTHDLAARVAKLPLRDLSRHAPIP
jgi:hypothetical protein